MKTVTLKISDEIHKALKTVTAFKNTTMQDYILTLIIKDMDIKFNDVIKSLKDLTIPLPQEKKED